VLRAAKKAAQVGVLASPVLVGSRESFDRAVARAREALELLRLGIDEHGRGAVDAYAVAAIFARMSGVQWLESG
jgi:hypothetical protein